jgi:hypothetical protein
MTEADWNDITEPQKMLEALRESGRASDRKLRLFAAACCRRIWHLLPDQECREAVQAAEVSAEGEAGEGPLRDVEAAGEVYCDHREDVPEERLGYYAGGAIFQLGQERLASDMVAAAAAGAAWCSTLDAGGDRRAADAARRGEAAAQAALLRCIVGPVLFHPLPPVVLAWQGGTVVKLAAGVYEARDFTQARLGVLADAAEEAGLTDAELLAHLRSPGPHARGCHALDLLLGKE